MLWILLVAVSVWLLSGVVVFLTILLGAWYQGRRERLNITLRPTQEPAGLRAAQASVASSVRETEPT